MRPLCIYHGGCDDGFGAAEAELLRLRQENEALRSQLGAQRRQSWWTRLLSRLRQPMEV